MTQILEEFPVTGVYPSPLALFIWQRSLPVDKVASVPILASSLFEKCIARFGLIRIIHIVVYSQLVGTVSELALLTVRAEPFFGKVFAQTAFDLRL